MSDAAREKKQAPMGRVASLRTLLVDDSHEFLGRLEKWLATYSRFEIVGKAYSGPEAVMQASVLRPDLVVMDVAMPQMNGYEAAVRIKAGAHDPAVILISFFDLHDAYEGSDSKTDAFLKKDSLYEELLPTVARLFPLKQEDRETDRSTAEKDCHGL